ncbi:hypothetical protein BU24DRAFT_428433 [Aaosphaeria arxii CBS 175.79]|uniref:Zn(2)-C6 fungal-type domain-containing protein n=1 Tax=Aaosphaeria arxii CBS 175.79 TaxID=1450172 RepID=A0A6A5X9H5_9PLEO|nr:uncharacterized protein BU24DRAFT_428433 [Aaosphaeria arxii CBS 175.79]KAF2009536.1 hypothetical protein BU24DRAFT_428433 [Aaosphaeria arxii CBS 175.79]
MPPVVSRRGQRIASKACDNCRDRKVQCVFESPESPSCRRCTDANGPCTFLKERKARGPPARRVPSTQALPVGNLSIELLCPHDVFLSILEDFLHIVYPVLPLVHRPTFRLLVESKSYTSDPAFFRLCIGLVAVTVASIPRNFEKYGASMYPDVGSMVDRACHLVLLSRISLEPHWQNQPSMNSMLVSILLTMASHYVGRQNQGWGYASEAIQFFRALELFRKEGYEKLSPWECELCKRAFWVLYIIQIHDRLSFIVPHTGLSFDPKHTDWEFLLPAEAGDDDLTACTNDPDTYHNGKEFYNREPPLICGFIALVKVFLCVVDLLSSGLFPGTAPQAYAMTGGSLTLPEAAGDRISHSSSRSTLSLTSLLRIIRNLQSALEELPEQLKITTMDPQVRSPDGSEHALSATTQFQFDIMRANIHITSLYIQSTVLEACSSAFANNPNDSFAPSPGDDAHSSPGYTPRTQLWKFRESIARELLEVLHFCSTRTLEASGSSMIVKIREMAATLLDSDNDLGVPSESEEQLRRYVVQFADILANLDYMGHSTVIPAIFSAH